MPDEFTSLSAAGKKFSDLDSLRIINEIPATERAAFAAEYAMCTARASISSNLVPYLASRITL
jgi:hypothetical protein